jgi:hypothetical protein
MYPAPLAKIAQAISREAGHQGTLASPMTAWKACIGRISRLLVAQLFSGLQVIPEEEIVYGHALFALQLYLIDA